jgi:hypothetical protein
MQEKFGKNLCSTSFVFFKDSSATGSEREIERSEEHTNKKHNHR